MNNTLRAIVAEFVILIGLLIFEIPDTTWRIIVVVGLAVVITRIGRLAETISIVTTGRHTMVFPGDGHTVWSDLSDHRSSCACRCTSLSGLGFGNMTKRPCRQPLR
jgi:hypothetical protein